MKTKNILKALAFALLLTTACNKSEIANENNTDAKGYPLPVTVNVTREGDDATKATYNDGTKKLAFSTGDKLFVEGNDNSAGGASLFAGTLDYDAVSGKFSGTITTKNEYSGTADALFTAAVGIQATLLPAGYEDYGYLSVRLNDGYNASLDQSRTYTLATSKAAGVEQFSYEHVETYSSGFALAPQNAILNFSVTGLAASTEVAVSLTGPTGYNLTKTVTTDGSGNAIFAAGISGGKDLQSFTLTVGGNAITLVSSSKVLTAGKIYNITRSAEDPNAPLPGVFTVQTNPSTITVKFSKGNLQLVGENTWKFADNQWDYFGTSQSDNHRDLFGWGTKDNPNNTSTNDADYSWNEWGENTALVSTLGTGWRTLTEDEWTYMFNTRTASTVAGTDNARFAKAYLFGTTHGIILFPDSYTHPDGVTAPTGINATGNTSWNANQYNATDWGKMEAAGAIFLPAAGYRASTFVLDVGSDGNYWSSTPYSSDRAYCLYFDSGNANPAYRNSRDFGNSVRLVQEVVTP